MPSEWVPPSEILHNFYCELTQHAECNELKWSMPYRKKPFGRANSFAFNATCWHVLWWHYDMFDDHIPYIRYVIAKYLYHDAFLVHHQCRFGVSAWRWIIAHAMHSNSMMLTSGRWKLKMDSERVSNAMRSIERSRVRDCKVLLMNSLRPNLASILLIHFWVTT